MNVQEAKELAEKAPRKHLDNLFHRACVEIKNAAGEGHFRTLVSLSYGYERALASKLMEALQERGFAAKRTGGDTDGGTYIEIRWD